MAGSADWSQSGACDPMALLSGICQGVVQVALDSPGDVGDAGEGPGREDLQQKRGEGEVCLVRAKAGTVSVAAARESGKLIRPGGMPAFSSTRRGRLSAPGGRGATGGPGLAGTRQPP